MFRVELRDRGAFGCGWSDPEVANGLVYRWMEAAHAELAISSSRPWQVLRVHCRFADVVRRDMQVEVSVARDVPAFGALRWPGPGMHHQVVVLDRQVAAGAATVCLDASQTWLEPGGARSLSAAFAAISGRARRRTTWLGVGGLGR